MATLALTTSTVKPLGDRVFLKVQAAEEKTAGGILLPDTAKEKPQIGEVVAVIKVGAATETEMKDRKLRLEDAIDN